jgi:hypothetical protein
LSRYPFIDDEELDLIQLQRKIENTSSEMILEKCFMSKKGTRYIPGLTPEFLKKCLYSYEKRPNCIDLKETNFYEKFSPYSIEMLIKSNSKRPFHSEKTL